MPIDLNKYKLESNLDKYKLDTTPTPTAEVPGAWSRIGRNLVEGGVGQEIIGIGKGIGQTVTGLGSIAQKGLQAVSSPFLKTAQSLPGLKPISPQTTTPTMTEQFGEALKPKGGWQQIGAGLESIAELALPTKGLGKAKGITSATELVPKAEGLLAKAPAALQTIGKAGAYIGQKVLNALPEAIFGGAYGYTKSGGDVGQAKSDALTFGLLSGAGELAGDAWKTVKGDLISNVQKALGAKGSGVSNVLNKTKQSTRALQVINKLAPEIKVTDSAGVAKPFDPTKATFGETAQAYLQSKQKIYDAYTELATKAGDKGATFTTSDFDSVIKNLREASKDSTTPFKNKANSLIKDLYDNFATKGKFKNTDLKRMQDFVQKVNIDVNPVSDKAAAEMSAKASQSIREIMDAKIGGATGQQYQKLRNAYSDLMSIDKDLANQVKRAANQSGTKLGGWVEGYGTLETVLSILSQNPAQALRGGGTIALGKVMKYLKDPEVALRNAFQLMNDVEKTPGQIRLFGGAKPNPEGLSNLKSGIEKVGSMPVGMTIKDVSKKTYTGDTYLDSYIRDAYRRYPKVSDNEILKKLFDRMQISRNDSAIKSYQIFEKYAYNQIKNPAKTVEDAIVKYVKQPNKFADAAIIEKFNPKKGDAGWLLKDGKFLSFNESGFHDHIELDILRKTGFKIKNTLSDEITANNLFKKQGFFRFRDASSKELNVSFAGNSSDITNKQINALKELSKKYKPENIYYDIEVGQDKFISGNGIKEFLDKLKSMKSNRGATTPGAVIGTGLGLAGAATIPVLNSKGNTKTFNSPTSKKENNLDHTISIKYPFEKNAEFVTPSRQNLKFEPLTTVGGYDFEGYAALKTDIPEVRKIYNELPEFTSPEQIQKEINRVVPNAEITGQDVWNAAEKYGINIRVLVARLRKESGFGTTGTAVKTKNPGNIGNTGTSTVKHESWVKGLEAVARELKRRMKPGVNK
jgi:hypothetical protein